MFLRSSETMGCRGISPCTSPAWPRLCPLPPSQSGPPFSISSNEHFLDLHPLSLRPAMKSIILALLPGLEEETAEDFDRTLALLERFKVAIRPPDSEQLTPEHSSGDGFFWQCFFLASITGQSRRPGALAYLVRYLPRLGQSSTHDLHRASDAQNGVDSDLASKLSQLITSPEPGLLLRCFAAGLADEQLLIQRGYLDILVTHLPLHSKVLQTRVKPSDLELLLRAGAGVVTRREMSLNRRLWAWFLGPELPTADPESGMESPTSTSGQHHGYYTTKTSYFEEYGLQPLTRALLAMINSGSDRSPAEKARPYRICLSLMDRWEIGGLVVPEVFLPIVDNVRRYKSEATSKPDFVEVLRSASVFFDGVESGLIYGEILGITAQAIGPGTLSVSQRSDKLALVNFILAHFNVKEEEMVTIHAPLTALSVLCMLDDAKSRAQSTDSPSTNDTISSQALGIAADLLELVPERAFPAASASKPSLLIEPKVLSAMPDAEVLKRIRDFYVNDQGNLDAASPPFASRNIAELLLRKASDLICQSLQEKCPGADIGVKSRVLLVLLVKIPHDVSFDVPSLVNSLHQCLSGHGTLPFHTFFLSSRRFHTPSPPAIVSQRPNYLTSSPRWSGMHGAFSVHQSQSIMSRRFGIFGNSRRLLHPKNRDIEAAISMLMIQHDTRGMFATPVS